MNFKLKILIILKTKTKHAILCALFLMCTVWFPWIARPQHYRGLSGHRHVTGNPGRLRWVYRRQSWHWDLCGGGRGKGELQMGLGIPLATCRQSGQLPRRARETRDASPRSFLQHQDPGCPKEREQVRFKSKIRRPDNYSLVRFSWIGMMKLFTTGCKRKSHHKAFSLRCVKVFVSVQWQFMSVRP